MENGLNRIEVPRLGPAHHDSPLNLSTTPRRGMCRFVSDQTWVRHQLDIEEDNGIEVGTDDSLVFEKAGPRSKIFFEPSQTRAAVVTCGGLCPGLNNVVRSLFLELHFNYGVPDVLGIRNGYRGLNPEVGEPPIRMTRDFVSWIAQTGGTILGSSRGPQPIDVMVDTLVREQISILFTVGGDGTQRGAHQIVAEIGRRGLPIAVVGIPKTIDNDIGYCSRTFGYVTAIEEARRVIHLAHTEANGAPRGIGLVKLMGRDSGFIACGATVACQEVNVTLIPEVPFQLQGPGGLLEHLEQRMDRRSHAVMVVSEGAGQHLFGESDLGRDASGNQRYQDIGMHMKTEIVGHFKKLGKPVDLKYIDPSYTIRSVPANCDDSLLCDQLARHAAHAAMAGRTDILIGQMNGRFVHLPIPMVVATRRQVDLEGELWAAVLATTGQPARFDPESVPDG